MFLIFSTTDSEIGFLVPNSVLIVLYKFLDSLEKKYVYETYNTIANHFDKTRSYVWPNIKKYIDTIKANSIVADIGCGNGKNMYRNPKPLLKAYYDIYHNEVANLYKLLPELHIPYNPQEVEFFIPDEIKSKVFCI